MVALENGHQQPLLEARHVSFGYSEQALLYDVSLAASSGEMIALLGPNGAGKTTLLRLLSGVLRPQRGDVLLQGRAVHTWGRREVARRVAVVPQDLQMPFAFTVEHMVNMGRTPFQSTFFASSTKEDETIVQEAMETAGIGDLAQRVFNELSGGERQRVMIAMALAQQPSVLLLDEPTAHLDIRYQIETLELVQRLHQQRGVTVIAAIHDLNLAARYFPRLLLFQRGIVADGSPAEVLAPALLKKVYGVAVQVGIMRGSVHLSVLPPGEEPRDPQKEVNSRIHVIAGGGSGEVLMRALADEGYAFSAGALNVGDSDHTLALRLADEVVTEQPYAPISEASLQRVRRALQRVALLILCPVPIGPGNLALVQEAVVAAQSGIPVLLLEAPESQESVCVSPTPGDEHSPSWAARDYTGGQGAMLLEELKRLGAVTLPTVQDVLEWLRQHLAGEVFTDAADSAAL
ncbi:heme ABC transporter ATP-binding protein [Ktedonobacter racemifer]|uniref:ABC transporter related protein n=1 Tax=Ktedonobacter racemifer DSM 44963 TaxID=485913 RepID=D6THE9_KTERA|nr:heme ABC transporter ATP-binding protein [Ktedonobacter racemifer]EFH88954.1 ABC transporter related protein [Ktedonobacter racemifer DSM 44963]